MTTEAEQQVEAVFTMKEVMVLLRLKRDAIKDRIDDGRLTAYKEGCQYRFKASDVQRYIDNVKPVN